MTTLKRLAVGDRHAPERAVLQATLVSQRSQIFSRSFMLLSVMPEWSFLTNHARALVCIAQNPGVRLRDIAATLGVSERTAFGTVTDLTEAGYVEKHKQGRRNRYRIQEHLPLPGAIGRERTIGEVLELLIDTRADAPDTARHNSIRPGHASAS
jgi:DNA-binding transcriptional ArsR family regulator